MSLATGFITISDLNESYAILTTKESVSITAAYDGAVTNLTGASTAIAVVLGSTPVTCYVPNVASWATYGGTVSGCTITVTGTASGSAFSGPTVSFASITTGADNGYVDIPVFLDAAMTKPVGSASTNKIRFSFSKSKQGPSLYTWIKYADDILGTGMSDSAVGKRYVGMAVNKTTTTESTTASDYTWSLLQSDSANFVLSSGMVLDKNGGLRKNTGTASSWSESAYSLQGYKSGCSLSFKTEQSTAPIMFGLNTDPATDNGYTSIDYCWYLQSGVISCYESGVSKSVDAGKSATYAANDTFMITYDNANIKYFHNGVLKRTVAAAQNLVLFVDSSFYITSATAQIRDVEFQSYVVPQWIGEWDSNKVVVGTDSIVSPKIFVGTGGANVSGVAIGNGIMSGDSTKAIAGYNNNISTWWINKDGSATFGATAGRQFIVGTNGNVTIPTLVTSEISGIVNFTSFDSKTKSAFSEGWVSTNSTFSDWPGADGTYPTGISAWNVVPTKETANVRSGAYGMKWTCLAAANNGVSLSGGFFRSNIANTEYFYVEIDFMMTAGTDPDGAGLLLDWSGMSPYRSVIKLSEFYPSVVLNKWYTIRTVIKRPESALTGYTGMGGYLMANYAECAVSSTAAKTIIFDRLAIREANASEIDLANNKSNWISASSDVLQYGDGWSDSTTKVNGWKGTLDETKINGGILETNSVLATSIKAGEITGDIIVANELKVQTDYMNMAGNIESKQTFYIDSEGLVQMSGDVKSFNYVENSVGWSITANGNAEFNDATMRGSVLLPNGGITNAYDINQNVGRNLILDSKFGGVPQTSTSYGFATKPLSSVLVVGQIYTLSVNGRCSPTAIAEGHHLQTIIYADNWSWATLVDISTITDSTKSVTFTVGGTGTYSMSTYLMDSSTPRTGPVTVNWYKLEKGTVATPWTPAPEDDINPIRIWSGTDYDGRNNAPFRVYQDGSIVAFKGSFGGTVTGKLDIGNIHISDTTSSNASFKMNNNAETATIIKLEESGCYIDTSFTLGNDTTKYFTSMGNKSAFLDSELTIGASSVIFPFAATGHLMEFANKTYNIEVDSNGSFCFQTVASTALQDFIFTREDQLNDVSVLVKGDLEVTNKITTGQLVQLVRQGAAYTGNEGIDFQFI